MKFYLILFLFLFSGCASYRYEPLVYEAQFLELSDRISKVAEQTPTTNQEVLEEWIPLATKIEVADGLTLAELNTLALFYSPQIVRARRERNIAGSQLIAAGLLPNPEIFVGPRISTDDSSLILPGSLSFPISLFGGRSATKAAARSALEAADFQLMDTEAGVLEEVATLYFKILALHDEVRVREEELELYDAISLWVESLFESGASDTSTLFLARSEGDLAYTALEYARGELLKTKSELFVLAGILPGAGDVVIDLALLSQFINSSISGEPSQSYPKLLAAKAEYNQAAALLQFEVTKQFPDLRFGLEGESDDGDLSFGFGLAATLPIFDSNQAGISAAKERLYIAKERYQLEILKLAHARVLVESERKISETLLSNLQTSRLPRINETRNALAARFESGAGDVLGALSTTTALTDARIEEITLRSKIATLRLKQAVLVGRAFGQPKIHEATNDE